MKRPLQHVADALDIYVTLGVLVNHPAVTIPTRVRERLPTMPVEDVVTAMSEYERVLGGRLHMLDPELPAMMDQYNESDYTEDDTEPQTVPPGSPTLCGTL